MKAKKKLGIWMDHSNAHLMEFIAGDVKTKSVESAFTHQVKEDSLNKSEHIMHNKEQQQQAAYYKQLGEMIKNYEAIILFGPTDAKTELLNILKRDHHFDEIKIEIQEASKMTENQQQAFVKNYFSKN